MLPEVEKYFELKKKADDEHVASNRELMRKFPDPVYPPDKLGWNVFDQLTNTERTEAMTTYYREQEVASTARRGDRDRAHAARELGVEAAHKALAKTKDPLVMWMVKHVFPYHREYGEVILQTYPAPLAELDQIADNNGWCNVWDSYRSRALAAGVLVVSDQGGMAAALEAVIDPHGNYTRRTKNEIVEEITRLVAERLRERAVEKYGPASHIAKGLREAADMLHEAPVPVPEPVSSPDPSPSQIQGDWAPTVTPEDAEGITTALAHYVA